MIFTTVFAPVYTDMTAELAPFHASVYYIRQVNAVNGGDIATLAVRL